MIKRILYATDLGLYGPYIMKQVAMLAQSTGAKVDVLHVIEPMGVFAETIINTYMPEKERKLLRSKGLSQVVDRIRVQVLDTLNSEYSDYLDLINLSEVIVEVGSPAEIIIEQSRIRSSDIVVVGSHGQHAYRGGLMGSVVTKVLQLSSIPIYMIPMVSLNDLGR
jgi:nucleotide-binding universal stress UspA family protein